MRMLVIVSGYASVGKTTIAKAIAKEMHAAFINGPATIERLMDEVLSAKGIDGHDFQTVMKKRLETDKAVDVLRKIVVDNEENGVDTVIELSTYYSDAHIVEDTDIKVRHVEITLPVEMERAQLAAHNPTLYAAMNWAEHVATRFPVYSDGALFEQNVVLEYDNTVPLQPERIAAFVKKIIRNETFY